ncbi:MAG: DUF5710 domain-containing protein [Methylotenera sp.]|nr:DUF5710 domain-containing protein [Methylotenera sp.]
MSSSSNIILKVPFNEKDQAKALGARWNAESKHWYVPQGIDTSPFEKWLNHSPTPTVATKKASMPNAKMVNNASTQSIDDDMDEINAKLRDAYEIRDSHDY